MINKKLSFCLILAITVVAACLNKPEQDFTVHADFAEDSRTLLVDFRNRPDTSLQEIIHFSGIRKEGYGVLLKLDSIASQTSIDFIKHKLVKQDINAVHHYDISVDPNPGDHLLAAIEGARFTWILSQDQSILDNAGFEGIKRAVEVSKGNQGILVLNR